MKLRTAFAGSACAILTAIAAAGIASAADDNPANWPVYHGNYKSTRFSALDSINKSNVKHLKVAWIHQPGEITGGLQATPIVIDGVLYYSSANNKVQALDAATGHELWRYQPKLDPVVKERVNVQWRGNTVMAIDYDEASPQPLHRLYLERMERFRNGYGRDAKAAFFMPDKEYHW